MNEKVKEIWKDPVWSKVISAGIIFIIGGIYTLAATYFPKLPFASLCERVITLLSHKISTPIWLLMLLAVPALILSIVQARKYFSQPDLPTEYLTVPEIADELGVDESQIYRWGTTGKLIFAVIRHDPGNFDEIRHEKNKRGKEVKATRQHRTISFSATERKPIDITYLSPQDTARIILNENNDRSILVNTLYQTNDLSPQKGTLLLNCPISVRREELIIAKDELNRFKKVHKSALKREKQRNKNASST